MSKENKIRGFYYEAELSNNYIAATLHVNTEPKPGSGNKIEFRPVSSNTDASGYSKSPLCSAIMPEDFVFEILNSFNSVGADPIGMAWSTTVPTVSAYYSGDFKKKIDVILDKLGNMQNLAEEKFSDWLVREFGKDSLAVEAEEKAKTTISNLKDLLLGKNKENIHSALSVQGTSYKSYSGSTITVGNGGLVMRFTIFSEFKNVGTASSPKYSFIPCTWEVNKILPYVIGEWEPLDSSSAGEGGNAALNSVKNFIGVEENFINWQRPPAGFEATYKNIDVLNKGTLKLRLGNFYYLDNLVIQQGSFNFSKTMAKIPFVDATTSSGSSREVSSSSGGNYNSLSSNYSISNTGNLDYEKYCPYSCDVALSLIPVSNYSRDKLINFMQGYNSPDEKKSIPDVAPTEYSDEIEPNKVSVSNASTIILKNK